MSVTSFYPVLMSQNVGTTADFYRVELGFETTFASDWYVSLRREKFELAILAHDHATVPEKYQGLPTGVLLNLEVDNVDEIYQRMLGHDHIEPVLTLRDEEFGQRHFIVEAPDGVLLDIIQPIPPSADFADAYSEGNSF